MSLKRNFPGIATFLTAKAKTCQEWNTFYFLFFLKVIMSLLSLPQESNTTQGDLARRELNLPENAHKLNLLWGSDEGMEPEN